MNICVTGANGFIGKKLVEALLGLEDVGYIYCLYRRQPTETLSPRIIPVVSDLNQLEDVILNKQVHILVHLAGKCNGKTRNGQSFDTVNVEGTKRVIAFCKLNGIQKIIYGSSINVTLEATGAYGRSKLMAEDMVKASEIPYMIIRPALVYGEGDHSLGSLCKMMERLHIMPIIGNGRAIEQPIYVGELVAYICMMIQDFEPYRTYTLGGRDTMTYNQMIATLAKGIGGSVLIIHLPKKLVTLGVRLATVLGIPLSINQEQIAHMTEDLVVELEDIHRRYPVTLESFQKHINQIASYRSTKK